MIKNTGNKTSIPYVSGFFDKSKKAAQHETNMQNLVNETNATQKNKYWELIYFHG